MKPKTMREALRESGVALGILLVPISGAFNPVKVSVLFVVAVSVIIYVASKRLFDAPDNENHPEEALDKAGRYFSMAAVTVCFLFNIFLLTQGDLKDNFASQADDALKSELRLERDAGVAKIVQVQQLPEQIRALDEVVGLVDHGNAIYAQTSAVIASVLTTVFRNIQDGMRYLFYFAVIMCGFVFVIAWFGKSVMRPMLAALQANKLER